MFIDYLKSQVSFIKASRYSIVVRLTSCYAYNLHSSLTQDMGSSADRDDVRPSS